MQGKPTNRLEIDLKIDFVDLWFANELAKVNSDRSIDRFNGIYFGITSTPDMIVPIVIALV